MRAPPKLHLLPACLELASPHPNLNSAYPVSAFEIILEANTEGFQFSMFSPSPSTRAYVMGRISKRRQARGVVVASESTVTLILLGSPPVPRTFEPSPFCEPPKSPPDCSVGLMWNPFGVPPKSPRAGDLSRAKFEPNTVMLQKYVVIDLSLALVRTLSI